MCFFPSSFANSYIDDNATHLWRHGYNVKNLCRCRQVRTGPNWDNAGAEFRKNSDATWAQTAQVWRTDGGLMDGREAVRSHDCVTCQPRMSAAHEYKLHEVKPISAGRAGCAIMTLMWPPGRHQAWDSNYSTARIPVAHTHASFEETTKKMGENLHIWQSKFSKFQGPKVDPKPNCHSFHMLFR